MRSMRALVAGPPFRRLSLCQEVHGVQGRLQCRCEPGLFRASRNAHCIVLSFDRSSSAVNLWTVRPWISPNSPSGLCEEHQPSTRGDRTVAAVAAHITMTDIMAITLAKRFFTSYLMWPLDAPSFKAASTVSASLYFS